MFLTLEPKPELKRYKCSRCQAYCLQIRRSILKNGKAYAVAIIECHLHTKAELFFFVTLGTWTKPTNNDHFTLACRYGEVLHDDMAYTLIDVPAPFDEPVGERLARDAALEHSRFNEFWTIVDFLLDEDGVIHDYYHHPLKSLPRTLRKK